MSIGGADGQSSSNSSGGGSSSSPDPRLDPRPVDDDPEERRRLKILGCNQK